MTTCATVGVVGLGLVVALSGPALQARPASPAIVEPAAACPLLTSAQLTAATGATFGAGTPISAPTSCQWFGQGKIVTLVIRRPLAGKSPVDQFNTGKASTLPGITVEPVAGVGDDAYYVFFAGSNRAGCGLVVKKGASAFEIRVYGFDLAQAKTVAKALSQNVASTF
jgi:hypothetical protein